MSFLTENKLKSVVDLPIALPACTVKQSDWLVIATVKLVTPQRLTLRALNFQLLSSTVTIGDIASVNKVVANLGIAYVIIRQNYISGNPGGPGAVDSLKIDDIGTVSRSAVPLQITVPGNYSVIVANNCQPSSSSLSSIPSSTSIDHKLCVTGQFRLELNTA
jgi:hypothetical protein